jgi:hypothetical protein
MWSRPRRLLRVQSTCLAVAASDGHMEMVQYLCDRFGEELIMLKAVSEYVAQYCSVWRAVPQNSALVTDRISDWHGTTLDL